MRLGQGGLAKVRGGGGSCSGAVAPALGGWSAVALKAALGPQEPRAESVVMNAESATLEQPTGPSAGSSALPAGERAARPDTHARYHLDLQRGVLKSQPLDERVVTLPVEVLRRVVAMAMQGGDLTVLRVAGKLLAEAAKEGLAEEGAQASPAVLVFAQARQALAYAGWGTLDVERWGNALVVLLRQAPVLDPEQLGIAALLGGLFSTLASRDVACVPMDEHRFLCIDPSLAEAAWSWSKAGRSLYSILSELEPVMPA